MGDNQDERMLSLVDECYSSRSESIGDISMPESISMDYELEALSSSSQLERVQRKVC